MKIYLAAPLFSEGERNFNTKIEEILKPYRFNLYLPQNNMNINDKSKSASSQQIFKGDIDELLDSDVVIAVLDGQLIDAGVASEIGYTAAFNKFNDKKKFIVGLYTDHRDFSLSFSEDKIKQSIVGIGESQFSYLNLFTIGCLKENGKIVSSLKELKHTIVKYYTQNLVGKKLKILKMSGEENYTNREGIVKYIDDEYQIHGTWGGCAIIPDIDDFEIIGGNE